jgi:CMP-N,N'-diacetyllegionaminic acid synthase
MKFYGENMNIVAMIPARSGSKGIKNKNIKLVQGKPLFLYTVESALSSRLISRTLISTDSIEMQQIAFDSGAEAPFLRPEDLSNDTACMVDVMQHFVDWLKREDDYEVDLLVTLYPTSPFRTGEQIDAAISAFIKSDADCLVSVSRQKHHPFWTLHLDNRKRLHHYFGKENLFYRRQDMPFTYEQNGAIYIVPPKNILKLDRRSMTDNTLAFIMDGKSSINIDDEMDFILADTLTCSEDE